MSCLEEPVTQFNDSQLRSNTRSDYISFVLLDSAATYYHPHPTPRSCILRDCQSAPLLRLLRSGSKNTSVETLGFGGDKRTQEVSAK